MEEVAALAIKLGEDVSIKLDDLMEKRGWKLAREDQPGIYVRRADTPAEDTIEWTFESPDMLKALHARQERRKRVLEKWNARRIHRMKRAVSFERK